MNLFRSSMLVLLVIFISGCSIPTPRTIEVTRIVKETVLVTQIVVEVVTATLPPPTSTPEITATPTFAKWTIDQTEAAITAAALEFEEPHAMSAEDYGMAPMVGEGVRFLIPSLGPDSGGRLLVFSNQADLDLMRNYYEELGRQSAMFFSWVFTKDNILIQINGSLPEATALKYQQALENMR